MQEIQTAFEAMGIKLANSQVDQLARLSTWLVGEGVEAGGVGPNEVPHIISRHIADGGAYAKVVGEVPDSLVDVGSGVGLPGSVLAILWPETDVTLLDRSGRRVDLAKRMARVVGISNVTAIQADAYQYNTKHEVAVMRASLPPQKALSVLAALAKSTAVLGLSRGPKQPRETDTWLKDCESLGWRAEIKCVEVLDPPAWLLRMSL